LPHQNIAVLLHRQYIRTEEVWVRSECLPSIVWKSAKFQISSPTRNFFRYSSRI